MTNQTLFGSRFEKEWFDDHLKVHEFISMLCEEFPDGESVDRAKFNTWLTEVTRFCLPIDVALLARELVSRGCIVQEQNGNRSFRYVINHETLHGFVSDNLASITPDSEVVSLEVTKLVNEPGKLRVMLEALLQAYDSDFACQRMSRVGMSKVALGSVGLARMKYDEVRTLLQLLVRRGFIKNLPVQHDDRGRIELLRDNIKMFLDTGIIPWVSKQDSLSHPHQPNPTQEENVMATTKEFEADDLRVVVKVGNTHNTSIPKLAPMMIHTILKEAGFTRGTFNFQAQGFWANFSAATSPLYGKVMSSSGPTVLIGLKCGKNREADTLSGHLSGAWSMKFTAVRQKLDSAVQRLNSGNWPGFNARPSEATASISLQPKPPAATSEAPATEASTAAATTTGTPTATEEAAQLKALMMTLIKQADPSGLLTTGRANEAMKASYPERSPHGLFPSLFGKLKARGWLRRVDQEGKVMLQIGTPFLRMKGLPITFEELPEIQSARSSGTRNPSRPAEQRSNQDTSSPAKSSMVEGSPPPAADPVTPDKDTSERVEGVVTTLKQLREQMQERDRLKAEYARLGADIEGLTASIEAITNSLSREDLIALALEKV